MFRGRSRNEKSSPTNHSDRRILLLRSSPGSIAKPRTTTSTMKIPANRISIGNNRNNSSYTPSSFSSQVVTKTTSNSIDAPRVDFEALILQRLNENNRLIQSLYEKVEQLEEKVDIALNKLAENELMMSQQQQQQLQMPIVDTDNGIDIEPSSSYLNQYSDFAERVKRELNLDINMNLIYNSHDLLGVPFSLSNINSYGTKLMDILFTRDELATHTIDPMRSEMPSLDPEKINMIKVCYLKKFGCIETFRSNWTLIRSSLKQKCLDTKRRKRRKEQNSQNEKQESPPEEEYDPDGTDGGFYLID